MGSKKKKKKMMKLPFLSQNDTVQASWPWPSCQQQPKTISFRAVEATPQATIEEDEDVVESVIKGLKSERLFFEPGETQTSSIMEEATKATPYEESVVLSMESRDPYIDFLESMEAMVEANLGLKNDWEGLEELLCWYLKANEKTNHGYIFGAFVDLLVKLAVSSSSTTANDNHSKTNSTPSCSNRAQSQSPSSPLSFYTSSSSSSSLCSSSSEDNSSTTTPCVSSLSDQKEIVNEEDNKDDVSSPVIESATAI